MKYAFSILLAVAGCGYPFSNELYAAESTKPNVVIIYIDDLGYADIGPFGATKQKTPNLDRMAREGMKFTSFYAAPVCSVSRAQLMTGCYGARVSVPGVFGPGNSNGLHPKENTIADLLKPQGYAAMCIGKWHLGYQPAFLPTTQGFDHRYRPQDGAVITRFYDQNAQPQKPALVNGEPPNLSPVLVYDGPFMKAKFGDP